MVHSPSRLHATATLLDEEPDVLRLATCPMCHTRSSVTQSAIEAGGAWRCVRCGQLWDAARLAAVAGYAAWVVDRDHARRRGTEDSKNAASYRDPPTERLEGTS